MGSEQCGNSAVFRSASLVAKGLVNERTKPGEKGEKEQQTAPESTTATSVGQFIFTALPQVGGIVPVGRSVSISGVGVRVSQTPLTRK